MPKGLSDSVAVIDRKTGAEVKGLFVLKPDTDPAARAALLAYAHEVEADNYKLATDLRLLVMKYEVEERQSRQQIAGDFELPQWLIDQNRAHEDGNSDNDSESNS